ncbi:TniQ family protein [Shewanella sp. 5S214]|uniref:TniQ family protein n=1 Tax=Shewanella sp. 5S214 TaxID=3229999 RepID=UPI00352CC0D9
MLLIRPFPNEFEGLPQYLLRVSTANGYQNIMQMLKLLDEQITNGQVPNKRLYYGDLDLEKLANLLNLPIGKLTHIAFQKTSNTRFKFHDQRFQMKTISFNRVKFCPTCYEESGILSLVTAFNYVSWCPIHHRRLIASDIHTNKPLTWATKNLDYKIRCEIDHDYISDSVWTNECAFNKLVYQLWQNTEPYDSPFPNIDLPGLLDMISFFERFDRLIDDTKNQAKLLQYLYSWPENYYELLAYYEQNPMSQKRKTGIRRCYRDLYDEIYNPLNANSTGYKLLKCHFEYYLQHHFTNSVFNSAIQLIPEHIINQSDFVGLQQACEILNCSQLNVERFIHSGLLTPTNLLDNGLSLFKRSDLNSLKEGSADLLSLSDSAKLMGVSDYNMYMLLNNGAISAVFKPSPKHKSWLISSTEVENLITLLQLKADNSLKKPFYGLKHLNLRKMNFPTIIEKMLNGELRFTIHKSATTSLKFDQFKFHLNSESVPKDSLSPKEASIALGVNKNVLYELIKLGFIQATKQKVSRTTRKVLLVTKASVTVFKQKYLLRHQLKNNSNLPIKQVSGPKIDGGLINIYSCKT